MKIEDLDVNMRIPTVENRDKIDWFNVLEKPFKTYGVFYDGNCYRRVPAEIADRTNEGVKELAKNTAGGRLRFRTNSPIVVLHAEMKEICQMNHMAFTGIYGFDLYTEKGYAGTFRPPITVEGGYETIVNLDGNMHTVTLNFPLYNNVDKIVIGLEKGSELLEAEPYTHEKPVVYYGSSITQGGCASRPGNSYQGFISRWLDVDHINLGFSGSGRGESCMAQYIASLDMSVFVLDYDHNAYNAEWLMKTHYPFYKTVRKEHPELPIIFVTRPDVYLHEEDSIKRRKAIYATYERAIAEGDRFVDFVDGAFLFAGRSWQDCTVDGNHPTDLGFYRMAEVLSARIEKWL